MNENPMTNLVIPIPKIKSMTRFCNGSSDFSTSRISAGTCDMQKQKSSRVGLNHYNIISLHMI